MVAGVGLGKLPLDDPFGLLGLGEGLLGILLLFLQGLQGCFLSAVLSAGAGEEAAGGGVGGVGQL